MSLKIQNAALATIIHDESVRQQIQQMFANTAMTDSNGGMTLDVGSGPIVVAHGKPSLADEKSMRERIRQIVPKAKLSRTNDIGQRVAQYRVAETPKHWTALFGKKEEPKKAGRKPKKDDTQTAIEQPTTEVAVEQQPA